MIGFEEGILTKAEFVDEHEVTLPLRLHMSKENIEGVTDA